MTGLETSLALLHTISMTAGFGAGLGAGAGAVAGMGAGAGARRCEPSPADAAGWEWPGGAWTLAELFAVLSWRPARIAGLDRAAGGRHGGPIEAGAPANLVVFDPADSWKVGPNQMTSRSRNTPFARMTLTGRVRHTIHEGEAVVIDCQPQR